MKRFKSIVSVVVFSVAFVLLFAGCPPWWENDDEVAAVAVVPQGHALDNNTVALWRLNETAAADNAADATGSYDLRQFGSPDVGAGHAGNARTLDGTTKFFQRQGDAALGTAMNGDWTFEGWVYLDNTFSTAGILYVYNGLAFSSNSSDIILAQVVVDSSRKIVAYQWHTTGTYTTVTSTGTLPTGQFNHVAVSRTAEGGNLFTYRIYVNGAIDNTTTGVSGLSSSVTGASHYIGLGCYTDIAGFGVGSSKLNGRLDDVRISKVARSAAEILQSYQR
jgi:hypothetical protein